MYQGCAGSDEDAIIGQVSSRVACMVDMVRQGFTGFLVHGAWRWSGWLVRRSPINLPAILALNRLNPKP